MGGRPRLPSLHVSMSLLMIVENVKLAREYALLGNHDSAMVYYQGVLDQMNKYLSSVKDTHLRQKWQQVRVMAAMFSHLALVFLKIRSHCLPLAVLELLC